MTNDQSLYSLGLGLALSKALFLLLLVLPGDGMFQAQRVVTDKCRPVVLHGYGGAKKEMPSSLARLARSGWLTLASAMVGSPSFRPSIVGWQ